MKSEKFCGYTLLSRMNEAGSAWEIEVLNRQGKSIKTVLTQNYASAIQEVEREIVYEGLNNALAELKR